MIDIPLKIKKLLKKDNVNKRLVIHFINGEYRDLTNEDIVSQESMRYVESSNSGDSIRLGISDASSFEVDVYDVPELAGAEIEVTLEIDQSSIGINEYYPVKIGYFIIKNMDTDYNTKITHIEAYDKIAVKLESQVVNSEITSFVGGDRNKLYIVEELLNHFLDDVAIDNLWPVGDYAEFSNVSYGTLQDYKKTITTHQSDVSPFYTYKTKVIMSYGYKEYIFDNDVSIGYIDVERAIAPIENSELWTQFDADIATIGSDYYFYPKRYSSYSASYDITYNPRNYESNTTFADYVSAMNRRLQGKAHLIAYPYTSEYIKCLVLYPIGYKIYTYRDGSGYSDHSFPDSVNPTFNRSYPNIAEEDYGSFSGRLVKPIGHYFDSIRSDFYYSSNEKPFNEDITLSRFYSDVAKAKGQFVRVNRNNGMLQNYTLEDDDAIYPSEDIFPDENLYPSGKGSIDLKLNNYSELNYKTKLSQKVGRVIATDRGGNEVSRQVDDFDEALYSTIVIDSNNIPIQAGWITAEKVCENILNMYRDYTFTPFTCDAIGLPFMQAGDWILVENKYGDQIKLCISRRTLSGIQSLKDSLSAGDI